jgi:metal-responsive CopG/Arc/MetJ family transcriptional regulator
MTVSLPPAMVKEFEKVRKAENRTRSELIREALRLYFSKRVPEVTASKAELAAIRSGRAQIKRGEYVTLDRLLHDLEPAHRKARRKTARKNPL